MLDLKTVFNSRREFLLYSIDLIQAPGIMDRIEFEHIKGRLAELDFVLQLLEEEHNLVPKWRI